MAVPEWMVLARPPPAEGLTVPSVDWCALNRARIARDVRLGQYSAAFAATFPPMVGCAGGGGTGGRQKRGGTELGARAPVSGQAMGAGILSKGTAPEIEQSAEDRRAPPGLPHESPLGTVPGGGPLPEETGWWRPPRDAPLPGGGPSAELGPTGLDRWSARGDRWDATAFPWFSPSPPMGPRPKWDEAYLGGGGRAVGAEVAAPVEEQAQPGLSLSPLETMANGPGWQQGVMSPLAMIKGRVSRLRGRTGVSARRAY